MNCIKCGREIPEGELFCAVCAMPSAVVPEAIPEPTPEKPRKKRKKKAPTVKTVRRLRIALAVCILLLLGAAAAVGFTAKTYIERRDALRIREAGVTLREKEADNRDNQIAELKKELLEAEETIRELQAQLAE